MLWLIPLGCFIVCVLAYGPKIFDVFFEQPGLEEAAGIILFLLLNTLLLSIIPFCIGEVTTGLALKTTIQNCTITSKQDFDYYRDKLTGLSPATISILTDLDIEQKKDVAASILQYENLGLLAEEADHTFHVTEKFYHFRDLNESDRYLINALVKGDFDWENDVRWKQLAIDEAVAEGYIVRKKSLWSANQTNDSRQEKNNRQRNFISKIWRPVQILLGLIWVFWVMSAYPRLEKYSKFFETPVNADLLNSMAQPEMMFFGLEVFGLLAFGMFILLYKPWEKSTIHPSNKKAICVIVIWLCFSMMGMPTILAFLTHFDTFLDSGVENINMAEYMNFLIGQPGSALGTVMAIIWIIYTTYLVSHLFAACRILTIYYNNTKSIERTEYGNLMAECILGMKNFINDYSNLSEADKRQVVLWEDYLVYAIVLEENENIINEILNTRRKILC
ncbi:MAG: DUF2207 family protein [Lachnospiraceae bacterium]